MEFKFHSFSLLYIFYKNLHLVFNPYPKVLQVCIITQANTTLQIIMMKPKNRNIWIKTIISFYNKNQLFTSIKIIWTHVFNNVKIKYVLKSEISVIFFHTFYFVNCIVVQCHIATGSENWNSTFLHKSNFHG